MSEKKKKSIFKRWWFWVIAVIVLFLLIPSGGDDGPQKVEEASGEISNEDTDAPNDGDEAESEEQEESEDEQPTEFGVGEKVELDGQVVVVTQVEKLAGSDFDKPRDGNEFVVVHVAIENNGDKEISYNPLNFKMQNSNGQIESQVFTTINNDTSLSSGKLAPGGNVTGSIAFEQPIDDPELQLIFEASFWSDKKITFNLQ